MAPSDVLRKDVSTQRWAPHFGFLRVGLARTIVASSTVANVGVADTDTKCGVPTVAVGEAYKMRGTGPESAPYSSRPQPCSRKTTRKPVRLFMGH